MMHSVPEGALGSVYVRHQSPLPNKVMGASLLGPTPGNTRFGGVTPFATFLAWCFLWSRRLRCWYFERAGGNLEVASLETGRSVVGSVPGVCARYIANACSVVGLGAGVKAGRRVRVWDAEGLIGSVWTFGG